MILHQEEATMHLPLNECPPDCTGVHLELATSPKEQDRYSLKSCAHGQLLRSIGIRERKGCLVSKTGEDIGWGFQPKPRYKKRAAASLLTSNEAAAR